MLSVIFHVEASGLALTDNMNAWRINNVIYASRTFQHFALRWNCIRCRGVICIYNSNYILQLHLNMFGTKLYLRNTPTGSIYYIRFACTFGFVKLFLVKSMYLHIEHIVLEIIVIRAHMREIIEFILLSWNLNNSLIANKIFTIGVTKTLFKNICRWVKNDLFHV